MTFGGATDNLCVVPELKFANGSDFTGWAGFDGKEDCWFTERPPNASSKPPKLEVFWAGGDCVPPNEACLSCCGAGCGFGAVAYKDKIDCFKSGRDGMFTPEGVDAALAGLPLGGAEGPPKKSSPRRESEAFVGLLAGGALAGGGCEPDGSVVLGLAGGVGTSPNRSMGCEAFVGGGIG